MICGIMKCIILESSSDQCGPGGDARSVISMYQGTKEEMKKTFSRSSSLYVVNSNPVLYV